MNLSDLLQFTIENEASDLHLSADEPPMIRVNGEVRRISSPPLTNTQVKEIIYEMMSDTQKAVYEEELELDFSLNVENLARFRVNAFHQNRGPAAVLRSIPGQVVTLKDLNAPAIFKDIADNKRGLVLVTGPTGAGKSTTLAALINHISSNKDLHIITIEDPIEFVYTSNKSLINQREVGRDTKSFNAALRSALREDPDVILVGEMRDLETIRLAMTAAETGHLVLGTLHTTSAPKTVDRIVDVFPSDEKAMIRTMLSESLCAVISQSLVKKYGGGRVAAHEIMLATPAIRNLIRENKVAQMVSVIQTSAALGMQTLDQSLMNLVKAKVISRADAKDFAQNKDNFK